MNHKITRFLFCQAWISLLVIIVTVISVYAEYGILIGSFKNKSNALNFIRDDSVNGRSVFVERFVTGKKALWYRACLGPYADIVKAKIELDMVRRSGKYKDPIWVVPIDRSAIIASAGGTVREKVPKEQSLEKKSAVSSESKNEEGAVINLTWDKSKSQDLTGYRIYYDTKPGPPFTPSKQYMLEEGSSPILVDKDKSEVTLRGLRRDTVYYFSITSVDINGKESDYSPLITSNGLTLDQLKGSNVNKTTTYEKQKETSTRKESVSDTARTEKIDTKNVGQQVGSGSQRNIAPGDVLQIKVPGQTEMSRTYDVDPEGNIYLLIIGKLPVLGMDDQRVARLLAEELKQYMSKDEKLSVELIERRRYVNVVGGVRYPGWYRLPQTVDSDLLLLMAGDTLPGTDRSKIKLQRLEKEKYVTYPLSKELSLEPNDIISVPFPQDYQEKADDSDQLFVSIPQRRAPTAIQDRSDTQDLTGELDKNLIDVDRNGYIYIPGYGHISCMGKTVQQIKSEIEQRLPRYLAELRKVSVTLVEKRHVVRIMGHVQKPGVITINESASIQEALNKAESAVDGANLNDCFIERTLKNQLIRIKVNLHQYIITGDPRILPPLQKDDTFFVPIATVMGGIKRTLGPWYPPQEKLKEDKKSLVRIFGEVNNPGMYEIEENMTLLDLLIRANGETRWAEISDILILRDNRVYLRFNLEQFLGKFHEGAKPIPKLQSGDTVYVTRIETKEREARERIFVLGSVKAPGSYELYDNMTVLQALAWAGGLDEWADSDKIIIVRMVNGKQENIPFNYSKAIRGREPEINVRLGANDVLVIP